MWLIISFFVTTYFILAILLNVIDFRLNIIGLYGVVLCCHLKRFSFSRKVYFRSHVQVFSCKILSACRLKYPYICFSSNFWFLVFIVFLSGLMLPMILLATVISLSLLFIMQSSKLSCPLDPSFLATYSLSMSSLGCKALCISINFLVLWSICRSYSFVHFKNGLEYLRRGATPLFIPSLLSSSFQSFPH